MQTLTTKHKSRSNDPLWYFLAEYSLSEFTSDDIGDTLMDGLLFQTIRDLGIPPECLNKIEMTLIGFVKQTAVHFKQGKRVSSIEIRLFYGKMIGSGNSTKTASDLQAKQTIGATQTIHPADTKIFGGWGFFIIERASHHPAGSTVDSPNFIDLYLYQEGV